MNRLVLVVLMLALVPACDNGARPPFVVRIVTPGGGDPADGIVRGTVAIQVRQLDGPIATADGGISGAVFEPVNVPITSYGVPTRIEVTIEDTSAGLPIGEGPMLIGASPPFVPLGYAGVTIVVGPPGMCQTLLAPLLSSDRVQPALVPFDANLVVIGGVEADGTATTQVEILSPVELTEPMIPRDPPLLAREIGAGGAIRLPSDQASGSFAVIALSEVRGAVLYYLDDTMEPDVDLRDAWSTSSVHAGAGPVSSLVDLGPDPEHGGVAIVGGRQGDSAVPGITWVDLSGLATTSELSTARARPSVVRFGDFLLVAGGQAEDQPLFELVSIIDRIPREPFGPTERRFGAVLSRNAGSNQAWLGFGESEVEGGVLLDTAYVITGCPSACVATLVDPISRPRRGFAVVERMGETLVIGGADETGLTSNAVDRIRFVSGAPVVEPIGQLFTSRHRPGAAHIGQGVVVVAGGEVERSGSTELRALRDMEICFPEALDPL